MSFSYFFVKFSSLRQQAGLLKCKEATCVIRRKKPKNEKRYGEPKKAAKEIIITWRGLQVSLGVEYKKSPALERAGLI
ncbi:hypothetical protein CALK_2095 [Chitinivibrio alkaliphilus ACht1]|uniref:Uncharacterized protein n=1 Tax=Chitinivibrio alkaliphilus ACht1 TaxID=1313304 RepID=U7D3D8_9BACT|nr:hypothetical protein CALK_2095 [Chitinivibrio alkaliphilus ACht1]